MATPQTVENEQTSYLASATRLVWVLNKDYMPYTGTFGGVKITVPPNGEKIPKRFSDGGNLMPYLEARRFITDFLEPQGYGTNPETGDKFPILLRQDGPNGRWPKALYDKELTEEELSTILGKKVADVKKEAAKEAVALDKKVKRNFTKNLVQRPGQISLGSEEDA